MRKFMNLPLMIDSSPTANKQKTGLSCFGFTEIARPHKKKAASQLKHWMIMALLLSVCNTFAQGVGFNWATRAGGASADAGRGIGSDKFGNVYTIADFQGDIEFAMKDGSNLKLSTKGGYDMFFSKQDAQGEFIWVKQVGGTGVDHAFGLDVDSEGNIYGVGYFQGALSFGGANNITLNSAGLSDAFTCKLNTDGEVIWAKRFGGSGSDYGRGITVDDKGNVYTIGYFVDQMDVDLRGGRQTFSAVGGDETIIMKQNANGDIEWMKQIGGAGNDRGWSIAVDKSGNIYSTGYYRGKADFDPGTGAADTFFMEAAGTDDAFVLKLNNDGDFLWARNIGGSKADIGNGIAVDQGGDVYVTGYFNGDCDFNPGSGKDTLSSNGLTDIFVAKFSTDGDFQWAKHMGGKGEDYGRSISVDVSGNCHVLSYFNKSGTFGTETLTAVGGDDVSISKLDPNGNFIWNTSVGGPGTDRAWSIKLDENSNIYVTGNFADKADFDPRTGIADTFYLRSAGGNDAFMLKMGCVDTSSSRLSIETCLDTFRFGGIAYTDSGSYIHKFSNAAGCDSTVYLALSFVKLNPVINVNGFVLGSAMSFDTYQWLLNGSPISGANDSVYEVEANGIYRLVVTTNEGCIDTSDVYEVTNYTGIGDVEKLADQINIYPNPAAHVLYIHAPVAVNVKIVGVEGKTIKKESAAESISVETMASGMYYLQITDLDGQLLKIEKFIKN